MGEDIKDHFEERTQSLMLIKPKIAVVLVDILKCYSDLKTIKHAAKWLQFLSKDTSVRLSIHESNGIPVLLQLLNAIYKPISYSAVEILGNILLCQVSHKAAVWKAGGLQKLVMILKNNDEKLLYVVMQCLHLLTCQQPENKFIVYLNDGPAELVRIMETYSFIPLLWFSARVLLVLSACPINRLAIVAVGGLQALAKHLKNSCQQLVITCLLTLRNLSAVANKQENVSPLLKTLIELLASGNKDKVSYAVAILSNMIANNPFNKWIVSLEGGVSAMVSVILRFRNDEEIMVNALCALCSLMNSHPGAEMAQNEVCFPYFLKAILKCFNSPLRWPIVKAAIKFVQYLSLYPNSHQPLLELDIPHILRDMLHSVYQEILRNRERLPCNEMQPTIIDGIKMEDLLESILRSFLNLAPNEKIRTLMKDRNVMETFTEILLKENKTLQLIIACIFCVFLWHL